jgi:hypothetical protein
MRVLVARTNFNFAYQIQNFFRNKYMFNNTKIISYINDLAYMDGYINICLIMSYFIFLLNSKES